MNRRPRIAKTCLAAFVFLCVTHEAHAAKLQPGTLKAWEAYVQLTEKRIDAELGGKSNFLIMDFKKADESRRIRSMLMGGQVFMEKMKTSDAGGRELSVDDGMIHHWLGSIFIPNTTLDVLLRWVQDYDQHHRFFKEVEQSKLLSRDHNTFNIFLRLMRKKVVTVHYNTSHTVVYRREESDRASSRSVATKIAELAGAGTPSEKEKPVGDDSGFFWRLNSYWRFKQENGGVFIECESISLSRSIPFGFGWLVKGYVESVPRESLEGTLTSIRQGVAETARGN
jgi:hypothetical protein